MTGITGSSYNNYSTGYQNLYDVTKEQQEQGTVNGECQTCATRKYKDGSNEMVSFKTATHISPTAAGAAVRAHEGEHVQNAYNRAAQNDGQVIRASVSIQTSVCPECGRTYVSGGVTDTAIKYQNEENPYMQNLKAQQGIELRGMNVDLKNYE